MVVVNNQTMFPEGVVGIMRQSDEGPSPATELVLRTISPCWDAVSPQTAGARPLCTSPAPRGGGGVALRDSLLGRGNAGVQAVEIVPGALTNQSWGVSPS